MKEKLEVTLEELEELMGEEKTITKKEICLSLSVVFLTGMVLGIFLSPKKRVMIGSNNGNNSGNNNEATACRSEQDKCGQGKKKCDRDKKNCVQENEERGQEKKKCCRNKKDM